MYQCFYTISDNRNKVTSTVSQIVFFLNHLTVIVMVKHAENQFNIEYCNLDLLIKHRVHTGWGHCLQSVPSHFNETINEVITLGCRFGNCHGKVMEFQNVRNNRGRLWSVMELYSYTDIVSLFS